MPANPKVIDRFNVDGEDYVIEPEIDPVPLQNSQRAVMSGGVWQQLHDIDIQLADTGDTAKQNSQGIFTRNGAFNYFGGSTHAMEWLGRVFADKIIDNWRPLYLHDSQTQTRGTFYYAKGLCILLTSDGIYVSTGSIHEAEKVYTPSSGTCVGRLKEVNGKLFLIRYDSSLQYPVLVSDDGFEWSVVNVSVSDTSSNYSYIDIAYNGSVYVIGGTGYYWSEDLVNWTLCTLPEDVTSGSSRHIINGGGLLVADSVFQSRKALYSSDGKTWQAVSVSPQSGVYQNFLVSVVYTGNGWIGLQLNGNYRGYFYSADGITWTQSYAFPSTMTGGGVILNASPVASTFRAVVHDTSGSYNGIMQTNDYGQTWSFTAITNLKGGSRLKQIYARKNTYLGVTARYDFILTGTSTAAGSGLFVRVGSTYQQANGIPTSGTRTFAVAYANGFFMAGVDSNDDNVRGLYKSKDGVEWERIAMYSSVPIDSIQFINGTWLPGGSSPNMNQYIYYADYKSLNENGYFSYTGDGSQVEL